MNDEPAFTPPRPAMPVRQHAAPVEAPQQPLGFNAAQQKKAVRSQRAKKAWQTRRANATVKSTPKERQAGKSPLLAAARQISDRHRTGLLTTAEAIELANLIVEHPVLRKVLS